MLEFTQPYEEVGLIQKMWWTRKKIPRIHGSQLNLDLTKIDLFCTVKNLVLWSVIFKETIQCVS